MGWFILGIGLIISAVAGIALLVKAFRVSIGWGFACMFVPFAALVFVVKNWQDTKNLFFAGLAGNFIYFAGFFIILPPLRERGPATTAQETTSSQPQASYASAAAPASPYRPPRSAYTPPSYQPPPRSAETPASTPAEEPKKFEQVYIDRATRLYYAESCRNRPAKVYRVAKSVALMQGFKESRCPDVPAVP